MKRRTISFLLMLAMLFTMIPAFGAEAVQTISSEQELADLGGTVLSGSYRLTADLNMKGVSMSPITSLKGTFDGDGHTISNLEMTGNSNDTGLFKEIYGGTVKNLNLAAPIMTLNGSSGSCGVGALAGKISGTNSQVLDCGVTDGTINASGGNYFYTGGLVGTVSGSNVKIANCFIEGGTVQSPQYAGGFIGYVSGSVEAAGCFSTADVTCDKMYAGGFIGSVSSGTVTVDHCYTTGNVTGPSNLGGFVGYTYCSYSGKLELNNCYAAGQVNGTGSNVYGFAYVYLNNNGKFENCYYDRSQNPAAHPSETKYEGITGLETDGLKGAATPDQLGDAYLPAPNDVNNGYPILKWQDPNATYNLTLTVKPADAQVVLTGPEGGEYVPSVDGSVYAYRGLKSGVYAYSVSQAEQAQTDLAPENGAIFIGKSDVSQTITLQPNTYDVSFEVAPDNAAFALYETQEHTGADALAPVSSGAGRYSFDLPNGTYYYEGSCFGYGDVSGSVTVNRADSPNNTVTLAQNDTKTMTFAFAGGAFADIDAPVLTVTYERAPIQAADADGLVFDLPLGYQYEYTFSSKNFARVKGIIDLSSSQDQTPGTETIVLSPKTAWEGAGDLSEPRAENGVYQISTGAELAWLAQQVGEGKNKLDAFLTKDIDLGEQEWTPIGTSSYAYAGTFDGQNHTITGLQITGSSGYQGLFGKIRDEGTVKNLVLEGSVSGTERIGAVAGQNSGTLSNVMSQAQVSGTSYYVGGITGYNDGTVEKAVNQGDVTSTYNASYSYYGAAGGIAGQNAGTISNCVNNGAVSGRATYVGGITGYSSGTYSKASLLENVYNTGKVTSTKYAGGIVGYTSSNVTLRAAYNRGAVEGSYPGQIVGYISPAPTASGIYYLNAGGAAPAGNGTLKEAAGVADQAAMQQALVGKVGQFTADIIPQLNEGWPILGFQNPNVAYQVTFVLSPASAQLVLTGSDTSVQQPVSSADGTVVYQLKPGSYSYMVTGDDCQPQSDTFTVDGNVTKEITLEANTYEVTLAVSPADALVSLQDAGGNVQTGTETECDGKKIYTFTLPSGSYTYGVSKFGMVAQSGTITVDKGNANKEITLAAAKSSKVTFAVSPAEAAKDAEVTVSYHETRLDAQPDGSFLLPTGSYSYTIRAKGYARAAGTVTVPEEPQATMEVPVSMEVYTGWDGQTKTKPSAGDGTQENPFEISTGEELAWLADFVNTSAANGSKAHAVLMEDINLGEYEWTPIANTSSYQYSSIFNGNGKRIEGLKITTGMYCGLFGRLRSATVKNLVVAGQVTSDSSYGGVAGLAALTDGSILENCGNEVDVTGAYSAIGGLIGVDQGSSSEGTQIRGCYNIGKIRSTNTTASNYVSGLIGKTTNKVKVADSYNAGDITGENVVACGLCGDTGYGSSFTNCYNIGKLTGKTTNAICKKGLNVALTNSYYLATSAASTSDGAVSQTMAQMQDAGFLTQLGEESWKPDSTGKTNNGYPILKWQKEVQLVEPELPKLETAQNLTWKTDADGAMTKTAAWDAVAHAVSYTVKLYDYQGALGNKEAVAVVESVTGPACDLTNQFAALPNGWYYFTVTAVGDGVSQQSGPESAVDFAQRYIFVEKKLETPQNPRWEGKTALAKWEQSEYAAYYEVGLYKNGVLIRTEVTQDQYLDLTGIILSEGDYTFAVMAHPAHWAYEPTPQDSDLSAQSTIYHYPPSQTDPEEKDWIAVTSAKQLIDLANVKDQPIAEDSHVSQQEVEWSKNYKLMQDIDFSGLSAVDAARTKTIGNVSHKFTGIFDGNGHKITGLTLSNGDAGLFGYIGQEGQVRNLTIEGANVLFADNAAILCWVNYGQIKNCAVINSNITADTGAIIGGMLSRNYGTVSQSYVLGGLLKSNADQATGHAGFVGGNYGTIKQCYSTMRVDTQSMYAGGFAGWSDNGGSFEDCFALGDVSAREYSGGFVGRINDSVTRIQNCYASNKVTVTGTNGDGFIGAMGSEGIEGGAFHPEYPEGSFSSCYFNADFTAADRFATAKTQAELIAAEMVETLGGDIWTQASDQNDGLPYLQTVAPPQSIHTDQITVELAVAVYDKSTYQFRQLSEPISVTLNSTGNTRVVDVLDAAQQQALLSYAYENTTEFGRYIHTINGYAVTAPDGWMFTVDDQLSNLSASLATVKDGNKILWYEGTTENRFQGPAWSDLNGGEEIQWISIGTVEELAALCGTEDSQVLAGNYRLTQDLNLAEFDFAGIGSLTHPFTGKFDGQNHTISNLTRTGTANVGLFNVICGAAITNLSLENAQVAGEENAGLLVGYAMAQLDPENRGDSKANLVGNCTVSGQVTANKCGGGLVGLNEGKYDSDTLFSIYSSIHNSEAAVTVTGTAASISMGGLVGSNSGYITQCSASGAVSGYSSVGGLAGSSSSGIYDSHASGMVTGELVTGGLVGSSGLDSTVEHCYSLGAVKGNPKSGGNIGGLIGAASGKVKDSVSAGTVTAGYDYSGGLIGSFSGKLVGPEHQVTLKNSYGNCVAADGSALKPIGNASSFQGEENQQAMNRTALNDMAAVCDKIYELFGLNLDLPLLTQEADKYLDVLTVAYGTEGALSFLKEGATADAAFTLTWSQAAASEYLSFENGTVYLVKQNDSARTLTQTLLLTIKGEAGAYRKNISVVLKSKTGAAADLMETIAAAYPENSGEWVVMDMAAYRSCRPDTPSVTTQDARQNYINLAIKAVTDEKATVLDRAKAEIILRSIGADTTKLYPVNSNQAFNSAKALKDMEVTSHYDAPWVLLANLQGNLNLTKEQIQSLVQLLKDNQGDNGLFGYTWAGVEYTDPDTAGMALAALASFYLDETDQYGVREDAKGIVDKALDALSRAQGQNGSFGNANTDAMILIGLVSLGIDPTADARFVKNGTSLFDGMLLYANEKGDGFLFFGSENALATEQAFRALIAVAQWSSGKTPFQIYDFSKTQVSSVRATGEGEVTKPDEPSSSNKFQVSFTLKTDTQTWIPKTNITVKEGSSVYHAFTKALSDAGITSVGAETGYVKSITKDGVTLSEFSKGENSGWLYEVNGKQPNIGMLDYKLSARDDIVWFFTTDWTTGSSGGWGGGSKNQNSSSIIALNPAVKDGEAAAEVGKSQVTDALKKAEGEITIKVQPKQAADKVQVELESSSVSEIADKKDMALKLELPNAVLTVPNTSLSDLAGQAKNSVRFTMETKEDNTFVWEIHTDDKEAGQLTGGIHGILTVASGDVVVLLADGKETIRKKSIVHQGKAYVILHGSAQIKIKENAKRFSDVTDSDWYAQYVDFASSHELFLGTTQNTFSPEAPMTRAMLVTVLHRLEDTPQAQQVASFRDVNPGAYYQGAVDWAWASKIIEGVSSDSFAPDQEITREQLVVMIYRYAQTCGMEVSAKGDLEKFKDKNAVSAWANDAVSWASASGILTGKGNSTIDPAGNATRAEVAAMLQRFVTLLVQ